MCFQFFPYFGHHKVHATIQRSVKILNFRFLTRINVECTVVRYWKISFYFSKWTFNYQSRFCNKTDTHFISIIVRSTFITSEKNIQSPEHRLCKPCNLQVTFRRKISQPLLQRASINYAILSRRCHSDPSPVLLIITNSFTLE